MEIVRKLGEMSVDEAFGAIKYAKMACTHKAEPTVASMFITLAEQEMTHSDTLYTTAHNLLEKHQDHEEYAADRAVLDYIHEMQVEKVNEAKLYVSQYRNG